MYTCHVCKWLLGGLAILLLIVLIGCESTQQQQPQALTGQAEDIQQPCPITETNYYYRCAARFPGDSHDWYRLDPPTQTSSY